ncbi:ABC transporter ATP-binding protein [Ornithinimicrobium cavernae]|uniref:ABC transporter ATP-binding protein n=1 Tax=Ornithinimicrobium cavernae TaxID=2666047 RepID=UPI000D68CD9D|nr:ABC transporter ATP-binding protein [Ornithinimicrobium cavernae]
MGPVIVAEDVTVAIARGEILLPPVSFQLETGSALAVVGPNGAGKTTLLRVLAGLVRPTAGLVTVAGASIEERNPVFRRRVAALIGMPPLARDLTVREHLVLVATSWGTPSDHAAQQAEALLDSFDLTRLARRFPHELSSGQVQLFCLALTLARPFNLLLVDEPEQRLDPHRLELVGRALEEHVRAGTTLVFASHSGELVTRLANQVLEVGGVGPAERE